MPDRPTAARPLPEQLWRSAVRAVKDPRLVGAVQALPKTAAFMARTRAGRTQPGGPKAAGSAPVRPTVGLAAQVLLDEVLISVMRNPKLFPRGDDYERAGADIRLAYEMWDQMGWLDNPESYHRAPDSPFGVTLHPRRQRAERFEELTFLSGYMPREGEPGRARWLDHTENRTVHAYVLRHRGGRRPWLVCFHGFGMGQPMTDLRAFRAYKLHSELGLNVATLVLPLHGPRQRPGAQRGEGFMSIDLIDSVHGLAQSAFDARSVIRWIRAESGEVPVGIYGVSLGGYVSALVASLEPGLACAIAGIPVTDLPDLYRRHSTPHVRQRAFGSGALGPRADAVHRVVSPLAMPAKLPGERRYIFAGAGDRMSTAGQAHRLWEAWGRPKIQWYHGGHIGFFMAGSVRQFVNDALTESGLATPAGEPPFDPPALLESTGT